MNGATIAAEIRNDNFSGEGWELRVQYAFGAVSGVLPEHWKDEIADKIEYQKMNHGTYPIKWELLAV